MIRSPSNHALWSACRGGFVDELHDHTGPSGYESFLWLTHRLQRDALFREAARSGLKGWLAPPIAFLSDLPRLFDIRERPISLLRRRTVIGHLAATRGREQGIAAESSFDRLGIGHTADQLIGELLPEGVTPARLEQALERLDRDDFAKRRNAWITAAYRDYLTTLERENRYDPRAIHAVVAQRIEQGALPRALNGAEKLHIYGLWTRRTRYRLIDALANQEDVEVVLYLLAEDEPGEWDELAARGETVETRDHPDPANPAPPAPPAVVPTPDSRREFEWVAQQVKRLVLQHGVEPRDVAVIARSGREDTLRAHEILRGAGIPTTARIRSTLAEVPAVKAVLQLLRAVAAGWKYRPLRHVLESAYFDIDVDLRSIDFLAREKRIEGLEHWNEELERLRLRTEQDESRELERAGVFTDRLVRDREALADLAAAVEDLAQPRAPSEWIARTRTVFDPGLFEFRKRLCHPDGDRWEIVRLDQQAVEALVLMLPSC
jgi:hypothetical protein